jgi:hypothetical protein
MNIQNLEQFKKKLLDKMEGHFIFFGTRCVYVGGGGGD